MVGDFNRGQNLTGGCLEGAYGVDCFARTLAEGRFVGLSCQRLAPCDGVGLGALRMTLLGPGRVSDVEVEGRQEKCAVRSLGANLRFRVVERVASMLVYSPHVCGRRSMGEEVSAVPCETRRGPPMSHR